ncbi:MAG: pantetheine-phosphate adenylyltransferase [Phycisphaerales bacterium]|nr:MAG: pantetheine-phosphate adenylyltransferase [Phycisphaerales bacterium]
MAKADTIVAVFPGAFDPITSGHLDIIRRGSRLFDRLIVAVGRNPEKTELFTIAERVEMLRECCGDIDRVEVDSYDGLTAEYVRRVGARVILRGIRDNVDLRSELRSANTNLLVGDVETVLLMTSDQHALTSSTLIKQIVEIGGYDSARLCRLLPDNVVRRLEAKLRGGSRR